MAKCKANRLYALEFRRQMVELVRSGRNPEELARLSPLARPLCRQLV